MDIRHLELDVTPDFGKRTVAGRAVWTFHPIAKPLRTLKLDAVNLTVSAVTAEGAKVGSTDNTGKQLLVTFAEPVPAGQEVRVAIEYRAEPVQGLYFPHARARLPGGGRARFLAGRVRGGPLLVSLLRLSEREIHL